MAECPLGVTGNDGIVHGGQFLQRGAESGQTGVAHCDDDVAEEALVFRSFNWGSAVKGVEFIGA